MSSNSLCSSTPSAHRRRQAGFTLLELVIGLALLGLLSLTLLGSLRFGVRAWEVTDSTIEASTEIVIGQNFIRRQLSQIMPADLLAGGVTFVGAPDSVRFTAAAAFPAVASGLYEFELGPRETEKGVSLQVSAVLAGRGKVPTRRAIVSNIKRVRFSYYGVADDEVEPAWHDRWPSRRRLPDLIAIVVEFASHDQRVWPILTVAPKLQSPTPGA